MVVIARPYFDRTLSILASLPLSRRDVDCQGEPRCVDDQGLDHLADQAGGDVVSLARRVARQPAVEAVTTVRLSKPLIARTGIVTASPPPGPHGPVCHVMDVNTYNKFDEPECLRRVMCRK